MATPDVACCLWFPELTPINVVHLCTIDGEEWRAMLAWAAEPSASPRVPAIGAFLSSSFPIQLDRSALLRLREGLPRFEPNDLNGPAGSGFLSLKLSLQQAVEQKANVLFASTDDV